MKHTLEPTNIIKATKPLFIKTNAGVRLKTSEVKTEIQIHKTDNKVNLYLSDYDMYLLTPERARALAQNLLDVANIIEQETGKA